MDLSIPISRPIFRFIASFNYQYGDLSEQVSKHYFYCNHLVYRDFKPYYYQGYQVMLYKPLPFDDSIDSEGFVIFKAYNSSFNRVYCEDIIDRFHTFKIIYPKSALGDYWGIKSNYEIADYDDSYYIPIQKKISSR